LICRPILPHLVTVWEGVHGSSPASADIAITGEDAGDEGIVTARQLLGQLAVVAVLNLAAKRKPVAKGCGKRGSWAFPLGGAGARQAETGSL
jgi:hypothetical protein